VQQGKFHKGRNRRMISFRSGLGLAVRRVLLLALVLLLAAYPAARLGLFEWPRAYDPFAIPDLDEPTGPFLSWQMKLIDLEPQNCKAAFGLVGRSVSFVPVKGAGSSCEVTDAIAVARISTARINPEDMRCAIAFRLFAWERDTLQPAARRLLGEEITEIKHFGSYNCRTMRGSARLSQHATANAFDIAGFRTKSGKHISVLRDWDKPTAAGQFLKATRDGLCDWFNVTLSPDYNAAHADHFHVDMGLWRSCR
jgi:hypothetical protein